MEAEPSHPDVAALYDKHKDAMWNAAERELRWVGLRDLVPDAVQEAVISLIKSPPRTPVRNWEAFMVQCAKRRAQDLRRSVTNKSRLDTTYSAQDRRSEDDDFADEVADGLDRQRLGAKAMAKVDRLDSRERFAFEQFKLEQRPQADVARDLGVSRARVSQLATAATEKIAAMLEEEGVHW